MGVKRPQPHDLVWGLCPADLPATAPAWAHAVVARGLPAVVRRAPGEDGRLPVGLRGEGREQRLALHLPITRVRRVRCPEALVADLPEHADAIPALRALAWVRPLLDALGLPWGVGGSAGYQLATGETCLHASSDLDLILRTAQPFPRAAAAELFSQLDAAPTRIDLQLQTPNGGVGLGEWAGSAARVLVKADHGAYLSADPWASPCETVA
ncbi:MAG: Phosphoribosyl-dephospho-CoA transferase [Stenotrophomonas maltophilia]|nr:MAG: Phosphoribosyl-dephospho-CoA transferase [Stenotrophomonas maltophilia]